jgi:DNA-binding NtrC family response regulator
MANSFRWQSLVQQAGEPLFVLNRQRRILFVNSAWEKLTALPAARARGLACKRQRDVAAGSPEAVAQALAPPADALEGRPCRVRRLLVSGDPPRCCWCDIEFVSLHDARGRLRVLGKVLVHEQERGSPVGPLADRLVALRAEAAQHYRLEDLDSTLPVMRRVAKQARMASQMRVPVLIVGEAGTGKHWLAHAIHNGGPAHDRTCAAVHCARLPAETLTELLFGAGGLTWRSGAGTIYLKEPAALPRDLQARLCQWLAEPEAARPRLIAGSTADLSVEVRSGRLLEELHCALATLVITLPPLRDRLADLPVLVDRLLQRAGGEGDKRIKGLTAEAWEMVQTFRWPGNIRELYAALAGAREHATQERIDAADLPSYVRQAVSLEQTAGRTPERQLPLKELMAQVERRLIVLALQMTRGNKSRAAEVLSVWRPLLIRRMKALGITDGEGT